MDLVLLVPGKDDEMAMRGLLSRHEALRIRPINVEYLVHPHRDPGCRTASHTLLMAYLRRTRHALVLFDHEGCGSEGASPEEIEMEVSSKLIAHGWNQGRAECVVIQPELEAWVWSRSPEVDLALGWQNENPPLREWLVSEGWQNPGHAKPQKVKEAYEAAIRKVRRQKSAAIFRKLGETVSFRTCQDRAFNRLVTILQTWFPA